MPSLPYSSTLKPNLNPSYPPPRTRPFQRAFSSSQTQFLSSRTYLILTILNCIFFAFHWKIYHDTESSYAWKSKTTTNLGGTMGTGLGGIGTGAGVGGGGGGGSGKGGFGEQGVGRVVGNQHGIDDGTEGAGAGGGNSGRTDFPSCSASDSPTRFPLVTKYGPSGIDLSKGYKGSGARTRGFLKKAKSGEGVKVGVLGGSVSHGHGLHKPDSKSYHEIVFDWIDHTFPSQAGGKGNEAILGAVPAVVVSYFAICSSQHIPDDVDLVLVDLDINSERFEQDFLAFDTLYRTLLSLPSKPAVISVGLFGLVFHEFARGWAMNVPGTQWNDIPVITLRNWLIPHFLRHPEDRDLLFFHAAEKNPAFQHDWRHINEAGHEALGELVVLYLQEQLCEMEKRETEQWKALVGNRREPRWPGEESEVGDAPLARMTDRFPREPDTAFSFPSSPIPQCRTLTSSTHPLKPLSSLSTSPTIGWSFVSINDKKFYSTQLVGSQIEFEVNVGERGSVGLFIWKSPIKGIAGENGNTNGGMGKVGCWIVGVHAEEGEEWNEGDIGGRGGTVVSGYKPEGANLVEWTKDLQFGIPVPAGKHTLVCQLLTSTSSGGREFRIQGVTAS